MSSVAPASSIASQPPVYTPPPRRDETRQDKDVDKLTATAVAAQSAKEAHKGLVVDIQA